MYNTLFCRNFSTFGHYRLLVKGLPFTATKEDLVDLFKGFDPSTVLLISRRKRFVGSAYVYLEEETKALEACKLLNGSFFKDRKLDVSLDFLNFGSRIQPVYRPISMDRYRNPSRY
ncbi:hypothetical protein BEWA_045820 [Theileria equi strain WA]|uniref:RRM domain-containing protein n=1 Tax=Theileria equi strain WA TaxID=1537102 RepID=L1LAB7_THEEQ|nr:hypothetical protein BEWA_045820 [Theileria equi strain WA]EKX72118.1 hypothetical protein BEWA_045820 [Theileria equi strain WA]|eukprot:XP_004831570.1 hypothetical protein BEWA_045820 [Theileria equi strain WA]